MNRLIGWFTLISLAVCWSLLVPNLLLDLLGGFTIGFVGGFIYQKLTGETLMGRKQK